MPVAIHRLVLTVEERRGEEEPVPVCRIEWGSDDLPSRAYFMAAIETAYASIELPYFPSAARVEIATALRTTEVVAAEPQDQAFVGGALWNAVVVAASGYDEQGPPQ